MGAEKFLVVPLILFAMVVKTHCRSMDDLAARAAKQKRNVHLGIITQLLGPKPVPQGPLEGRIARAIEQGRSKRQADIDTITSLLGPKPIQDSQAKPGRIARASERSNTKRRAAIDPLTSHHGIHQAEKREEENKGFVELGRAVRSLERSNTKRRAALDPLTSHHGIHQEEEEEEEGVVELGRVVRASDRSNAKRRAVLERFTSHHGIHDQEETVKEEDFLLHSDETKKKQSKRDVDSNNAASFLGIKLSEKEMTGRVARALGKNNARRITRNDNKAEIMKPIENNDVRRIPVAV